MESLEIVLTCNLQSTVHITQTEEQSNGGGLGKRLTRHKGRYNLDSGLMNTIVRVSKMWNTEYDGNWTWHVSNKVSLHCYLYLELWRRCTAGLAWWETTIVALWLELRTAITPSNEIEGSYDAIIITIVPVLSCVLFAILVTNNQWAPKACSNRVSLLST